MMSSHDCKNAGLHHEHLCPYGAMQFDSVTGEQIAVRQLLHPWVVPKPRSESLFAGARYVTHTQGCATVKIHCRCVRRIAGTLDILPHNSGAFEDQNVKLWGGTMN